MFGPGSKNQSPPKPWTRIRFPVFSVTILGSGSTGNCALLTVGRKRFLVDTGISARQIAVRLAETGMAMADVDGIFLTHEHIDHVSGLPVLLRKYPIPVFCNSLTAEALRYNPQSGLAHFKNWKLFKTGSDFSLDDLHVQTFTIPHDASDPVGFIFHHEQRSIGFLTDLGYVTKLAVERIRDVHTLVLESNHDEKMLIECTKRPWSLKQRILSKHGHLSNVAAATLLQHLSSGNLRMLVLSHLSRDCNTPAIAERVIQAKLTELEMDFVRTHCASPVAVSAQFSVSADGQREKEKDPVQQNYRANQHSEYVAELFREWAEADPR